MKQHLKRWFNYKGANVDYYIGKENKKTERERDAYWEECRKEKRVAIFVHKRGPANSSVKWNADSIFGKAIMEDNHEAMLQLDAIVDAHCGKKSYGGYGPLHGHMNLPNESAEHFAKKLRVFLDNIIIEII